MRVAIFGATGGTGQCLIQEALARGHEVTALARDPGKVSIQDGRLKVYEGDVLDPATLAAPVAGADAVLSALGIGYQRIATNVFSDGTRNVLKAMDEAGVSRFTCISASSIELPPKSFVRQYLLFRFVLQPLLRRPYVDIRAMEEAVRSSDTDWTIVRAARLTNGDKRGGYRTAVDGKLARGFSISRSDLADYMINSIDDPAAKRAIVEVAY